MEYVLTFFISTYPLFPSTATVSPSLTRDTSILSTMGTDEITAPVVTIVSALLLTSARGACPCTFRSYTTYDPTVDPLPLGNRKIFSAMFPSRTLKFPVLPSTPPRKLKASPYVIASPSAYPGEMARPFMIILSPSAGRRCPRTSPSGNRGSADSCRPWRNWWPSSGTCPLSGPRPCRYRPVRDRTPPLS